MESEVSGLKPNKYKELISNTLIFAIGSFGSKIISFLLVPLYTNLLSAEQYGRADLITTVSNLAVPIFSLVFQDAVLRFGLSGKYRASAIAKNSFLVLLIGSILSLGLVPLINMYAPLSEWRWYIYVILVTNMFSNVFYAYARSLEKNKIYAIAGIINSFFLAIANIIFLVFLKLEIRGYLWANIGAHIISVLFLIISTKALRNVLKEKIDLKLLRQMICFSAPLIVNNLSWWILNSSNRIMIESYCSTYELGLFTAASKIPNLLSVITSIFSAAWTASSIKEYENDNDKSFFSNIFKTYSLIMFFGQAFILLILKWFMKYYVGEEFYDAWKYVPLILGGTVFFAYSTFFEAIYQALKKSVRTSITTIIAAIINLIVTFIMIGKYGVWAACIAFFVSYLVLCMIRLIDSRKFFNLNIKYVSFALSAVTVNIQAILITLGFDEIVCFVFAISLLLFINISDLKICIGFIKNYLFKKRGK